MKHSILINTDDIVELKYVGEITEEDNMRMIELSYVLINELIDKGNKPLVLVDLTQSDNFKPPAINTKAMRDSDAFRMAGFGIKNPKDLQVAKDLIEMAGKEKQVKIFDSRAEAVVWLKS